MNLSKLLNNINILEHSNIRDINDIDISNITFDSRDCTKNSMFIAVNGTEVDGHKFIASAIDKGAEVIIYEEDIPAQKGNQEYIEEDNIVYIRVENSRLALAVIAANFYDNPSYKLNLVGVTGTNGKTTIATLLYQLFTSLGYECGLISTIANYIGRDIYATEHTTPDPIALNKLIHNMVEKGCEYCFMEVSSHSLAQDRVSSLSFKGAIFTNLTHDHLDYHKTFAEYLRCKKLLFDHLDKGAFAITNIDDKNGEVMLQNTKASKYTYSLRAAADFNVKIIEQTLDGNLLKINGTEIWTRFIGKHNAHNLAAVYAAATLLGVSKDETLTAISGLKAVSGRLEYIKGGDGITAVVDYAHTPDALENVLTTLKGIKTKGNLIAVFGCGGNRDKTKRPEMGVIAAKYADKVVVTSDNPRHEDPDLIIKDIKDGMDKDARRKSLFITNRKEAIRTALTIADKNDIVLIAGKGHEDYQIIGDTKYHLDDKEIIKEFFKD